MSVPAPTPPTDPDAGSRRRRALQRYAVLDTPSEPAFDRLADLAAHLFDAPIALVTFADADRLWFKACLGLDRRAIDLDASFCVHTIRAREVLRVDDASTDPRFADNPLVTGTPGVRFYAGAPLITPDGHALGTLCVMDTTPRSPSPAQLERLDNLAAIVVDELELRREATERRRSEQRFQDVVQAAGEYVWETDAAGRYTYITEQAEAVKGRPADALLGHAPTELMPDADASHTRRVFDTARATGKPFALEHRTTTPDGTLRWEQVRGRPILDADGTLTGFRGTGLDVTARKEASMRLRLQSETLAQIARGEPLRRILGTLVESVEAQRPGMIGSVLFYDAETNTIQHGVAPNLPDAYNAAIDGLEIGPNVGSCGTAMHTRSTVIADDIETDPRWADYRDLALTHGLRACWSAPLITDDGEILGSFALYYDEPHSPSEADRTIIDTARTLARIAIERHRDVDALRRGEARLRGLANSVPGVLYSMYKTPDGRYISTFIGAQAESMFGISADPPDDFSDRFLRRIPDSHREAVTASIERALEAEETWSATFPFERPDGETIWVRGIATPETRDGEQVFNGVLLDITRRKDLEDQLLQAQKMETVGTLAGGIAHDFNNILHATKAYLELLADELPDDPAFHTTLDHAFTGLDRASGLVDRLLTFSRAEGKTVETTLDLSAVVADTIELARPALPTEAHLRTEAPEDCFVLGDPGQLQQVVMNLITNAAQAMEGDSGESVLDVAVRTMRVDPDLARQHLHLEPGRYVRLTVSDTGSGMDTDTQARIFEPFFTTKDVDQGTGLGLSVVHGIVQAHDGDIGVHSEPGEGTSFHVYLPAAGPDEGEGDDPSPVSAHLLLVDDDEQVRDLETVRLTRMGYQVTAVADADAALDALSEAADTYDLMISDYLMPGMNGLDLLLRLRDRGHTLPVFIMSGFSARISEPDVLQAGASAFLRKPVGSRELDQTITAALQGDASC